MRRILASAIRLNLIWLVASASHLSRGEDQKHEPADEPPVIQLTISPAAEAVPALKFRLLPPISEQTHGNAAIDYELALNRNLPPLAERKKLDPWLDLPPDGLPRKNVEETLQSYATLLSALEQASHRDMCDWQVPIARDGFNTSVDEFQGFRVAAKALALKARLQIASDDLDGALSSMRTIFKTSRDCNQGRLLITSLIACAAAAQNTDTLQAFVQHPKAPNLYWALTDLPSPLVDCRPAIDLEAMAVYYEFPQLAIFRSRRLSAEEARRQSDELLARWYEDIKTSGGRISRNLNEARTRFASAARAANDKQVLLDSGWSKADVAAMAPEQVAWLILDYHWRVYRDELIKWAGVAPPPQRMAGAQRSQERFKEFVSRGGNPLAEFELLNFMPAIDIFYASVDRRDRPIALFRIVEALRMHAAAHQGQLPTSLEAIDAVPIPVDPMSGNTFLYRVNGDGTADLQTPAIHPNNRFYGRHYVIHVRKGSASPTSP